MTACRKSSVFVVNKYRCSCGGTRILERSSSKRPFNARRNHYLRFMVNGKKRMTSKEIVSFILISLVELFRLEEQALHHMVTK
jgi:hypothetical protein